MVRSIAICLVLAALTIEDGVRAPAQALPASVLVERAGRFVAAYEDAFQAVLAEEHQIQKLTRADGRVRQARELRSDFLLVKTATGILAFRDVVTVDRKPVRPRADRLRRLFLDGPRTALEQARALSAESERHNLGMSRALRSPLLPLVFLRPGVSAGFRFTAKDGTLTFQEVRTPGVLAEQSRGTRFNLMTKGTFQLETASGQVLAADFSAQGPPQASAFSLAVRYRLDQTLGLMVPVSVKERHWFPGKPQDDRLEVTSTYTNFRQFEVTR